MRDRDWRDIDDPEWRIVWLQERGHDPWGRKLRLLAVSCCRRLWPLLPEIQRAAVEAAERIAEGAVLPEAEWRRLADAAEDCEGFEIGGPVAFHSTLAISGTLVDFDIRAGGIQFAKNIGFGGSCLGVPLGATAAASQKQEWKIGVGRLRHLARLFEDETGFAIGMKEFAVFE